MLLLLVKSGGCVHVLLCAHVCMLIAICCFLARLGSYTAGVVDIVVLRTSKWQLGMLEMKWKHCAPTDELGYRKQGLQLLPSLLSSSPGGIRAFSVSVSLQAAAGPAGQGSSPFSFLGSLGKEQASGCNSSLVFSLLHSQPYAWLYLWLCFLQVVWKRWVPAWAVVE